VAGIAAIAVVIVRALPYVRPSSQEQAKTAALVDLNKRIESMEAHLMSASRMPAGLTRRA
jgi:hypothetical protein